MGLKFKFGLKLGSGLGFGLVLGLGSSRDDLDDHCRWLQPTDLDLDHEGRVVERGGVAPEYPLVPEYYSTEMNYSVPGVENN